MKRFWYCLLVLLLLCGTALADGATIVDRGVDLGASGVHVPTVRMTDQPDVEKTMNDAIAAAIGTDQLLNRLPLVMNSAAGLHVSYSYDKTALDGGVLSALVDLRGAITDTRNEHAWVTLLFDLKTGKALHWQDFFRDADGARQAIEALLTERIAPELSAHLQNADLLPLPDAVTVHAEGLTFAYPYKQLSTLSDRAGRIAFTWGELKAYLDPKNDLLQRIGASRLLQAGSAEDWTQLLADGSLPGIPAKLGDAMPDLIQAYGMLTDPDLTSRDRVFALEDASFRDVLILTDSLSEGWESSIVQGIRSRRITLFGLSTGETRRDAWLQQLGEPESSVDLDADRAEADLLSAGTSDYYSFGSIRLRLHADADGVLEAVEMTK